MQHMPQILYSGLQRQTLQELKNFFSSSGAVFTEMPVSDYHSYIQNHVNDALLLGEELGNPIRIAQDIHGLDKYLSILIINQQQNFDKIKQALLFTPFIGNTVQAVSNQVQELARMVDNHIRNTQQRRKYASLKNIDIPLQKEPVFEHVKTEFLDKFLQQAPVGAILMNQMGSLLAINDYAARTLDKTEREVLGHPLWDIFPEPLQKQIQELITSSKAPLARQTFEVDLKDEKQYLEIRVAVIEGKNFSGYKIAIIVNLTEMVLAQQKIQQQLQELEKVNETLRKVNHDLDTFVYTASHDLKAPITNIEGLLGMLERRIKVFEPGLEQIMEMMKQSVSRFNITVADLAEVARLQKRTEGDLEKIDISGVVDEVLLSIHDIIEKANAEIRVDCTAYPFIVFSKKNLKSIIYNLVSNAIKYASPDRPPQVVVTSEKVGEYVLLSVRDNGLGIPANKQKEIYTMFKRLHHHVEGTGVGLYIVKRIVENAKGEIKVESKVGEGSVFKLYFPLVTVS